MAITKDILEAVKETKEKYGHALNELGRGQDSDNNNENPSEDKKEACGNP